MSNFGKKKRRMNNAKFESVIWCFGCVFVLYIEVLNVSMRFNIRFCIYEHIQNCVFATLFENIFPRNDGDATPFFNVFLSFS